MFARDEGHAPDGVVVVVDDPLPPQAASTKSNSIAGKSLKNLCTLVSPLAVVLSLLEIQVHPFS